MAYQSLRQWLKKLEEAEFVDGEEIHQLCKHGLPYIHGRSPSALMLKDGTGKRSFSNP